jgi:hypothetical protein
MQAKFVNMALRMVAMLTMGATQALAGAGAIKGGAARRLRQKQSTKPWQRGALSLIGVTLAAAALLSAPPAAASRRQQRPKGLRARPCWQCLVQG